MAARSALPLLTALSLLLTLAAGPALAQSGSQLGALKGKIKEGRYSQKMEMDMGNIPGMPAGMAKKTYTIENCVSDADIEKGELGRRDKNAPDCQVRDVKVSSANASYRMVCKGDPDMTMDVAIAFAGDSYRMTMKSVMDMGGQKVTSNMAVDAKYLGPCKK